MALKIKIDSILPKRQLGDKFQEVQNEIRNYLQTVGAAVIIKELNKTTEGWNTKPTFIPKVTIPFNSYIRLSVEPYGTGKSNWIRINNGTGPRTITSGKGLMHFQVGYKPKTTAGGQWGGPGSRSGRMVWNRRQVHHHRIKPRNFVEHVLRSKEIQLKLGIDNIIRKNI